MRLTKQSSYAVRIVVECALAEDGLTRIVDIAQRYNITKHNVAKIVPLLVRSGIIEAVRGRSGGIRLARPAGEITIGEIVRASEATICADVMGGNDMPIGQILDGALEAFISVLDGHTVADLVAGRRQDGRRASGGHRPAALTRRQKAVPARRQFV